MNWMRRNVPRIGLRERLHGQRLGEPRHALDEQVALREDRDQHALEEMVLADDDLLDLVEDPLHRARRCPRFGRSRIVSFRSQRLGLHRASSRTVRTASMPTAATAAFSIGTAKPMPMNTRCSVGFRIAGDDADDLAVHR